MHTLRGHEGAVLCLCVGAANPASSGANAGPPRLFSGSYDRTVAAWDARDGRLLRRMRGHTAGVHAVAWSPRGGMSGVIYSGSSDNSVRAWDADTGACLKTFFGQHAPGTWPVAIAVSDDGSLVATASKGHFGATSIKLWLGCVSDASASPDAGRCLATLAQLPYGEGGAITCLAFVGTSGVKKEGGCEEERTFTLFSGATDGSLAAWHVELTDEANDPAVRSGFLLRR